MKLLKQYFLLLIFFSATGCRMIKENTSYSMESGWYKSTISEKSQLFWVQFTDTVIQLFPFQTKKEVNKNNPFIFSFNEMAQPGSPAFLKLSKSSLDIDVLTIPFKYRSSIAGFPNQLNTNFSTAIYAGFRNDRYRFFFSTNPVGGQRKELKHFGIGVGVFTGLGSTAMNPWTTQDQVQSEYDGFVFMNGIAGIVAVSNFTFGVGIGLDALLDKNKRYWIYQHKPWIGLTVGLNIN